MTWAKRGTSGNANLVSGGRRQYNGLMRLTRESQAIKDKVAGAGASSSAGDEFFALRHHNFNVVALADTSGTVVERYDDNPYGERFVLEPTTSTYTLDGDGVSGYAHVIGHQGLHHDTATGLVYNRARTLNPALGRFMQRDPLGYVDGMGLYEYVSSVPTFWADPSGLFIAGRMGERRRRMANLLRQQGATQAAQQVIDRSRDASRYSAMAGAATVGAEEAAEQVKDEVTDPVNAAAAAVPGGKPATTAAKTAKKAGMFDKAWQAIKKLCRRATDEAADAADEAADAAKKAAKRAQPPVGRRGEPMNVPKGTNPDTTIQGRNYVGHAIDQMQGRGIPPSAVEDTIRNGTRTPDPLPGRTRITALQTI